ncbi:hypothetical protein MMC20_001644 [Loxospora ochrophaea]|nr:hypothetical protein [Loxospora ochrophaea]
MTDDSQDGKSSGQEESPVGEAALTNTSDEEYLDSAASNISTSSGPSPSPSNSGSRATSRKRRAEDHVKNKFTVKRLKITHLNNYSDIFNGVVGDIAEVESDNDDPLPPSQIGLTKWSSQEKRALFSVIAKKGRDDVRGVAKAIRTKSPIEVYSYLKLLRKESESHPLLPYHLPGLRSETAGSAGAYEISAECTFTLDSAAHELSKSLQEHEEQEEQRKYGELWLLDERAARGMEDILKGREAGVNPEKLKDLLAFELLDLQKFLELSSRVFMNSNSPQQNWTSYAELDEKPSMMFTAFLEIYQLTMSITKRLIQSALFYALSRARATSSGKYTVQASIRKEDITAAVNVLGIKANAGDFWTGAARRCNLDIYESVNKHRKKGSRLSYEEVERELGQAPNGLAPTTNPNSHYSQNPVVERRQVNSIILSEELLSASVSGHTSPTSSDSSVSSPSFDNEAFLPRSKRARKQFLAHERRQDTRDAYLDALDQQASQQEEQRLRAVLGMDHPAQIKPEEISLPTSLSMDRKTKVDLEVWQDWVEYRSEWETYERPVFVPRGNVDPGAKRVRSRRSRRPSIERLGIPDGQEQEEIEEA